MDATTGISEGTKKDADAAERKITIELVDVGTDEDAPQGVRLRMLLKRALRDWKFRCTGIR